MTSATSLDEPVQRGRAGRPVPTRTRLDFWLDLVLLIGFTLDDSLRFTGLSIREWLGLGFGLGLVGHVVLHWDWVRKAMERFGGTLAGHERIRWVLIVSKSSNEGVVVPWSMGTTSRTIGA